MSLHTHQDDYSPNKQANKKTPYITRMGKDMERLGLSLPAGGKGNGCSRCGKHWSVSSGEINLIQQSRFWASSQRSKSRDSEYLHAHVRSSAIHNGQGWKQADCPSVDEWIHKMCYSHTIEYCPPPLKRKEILTNAIMWMNLEDMR